MFVIIARRAPVVKASGFGLGRRIISLDMEKTYNTVDTKAPITVTLH